MGARQNKSPGNPGTKRKQHLNMEDRPLVPACLGTTAPQCKRCLRQQAPITKGTMVIIPAWDTSGCKNYLPDTIVIVADRTYSSAK